ncbi:MAG: MFS transporter, partial [Acidobacteriota bacterium]
PPHPTPMSTLRFVVENRRYLLFGFLLAFVSSFGQTWFIGLFKERLLVAHDLTHGSYGSWYALATLLSATCLGYLGRRLDDTDLRRYTLLVFVGLALSGLAMAWAGSLPALIVALFGLRLTGQGLMSHVAGTATSRYFDRERGRALGLVNLGHPLGEALLPLAIVGLLAVWTDWRHAWLLSSAVIALVVAPMALLLLRGHDERHAALLDKLASEQATGSTGRQWTASEVLRDPGFYRLLPAVLAPPFIGTGLMFHQDVLRSSMDWSAELYAASFTAFSLAQVLAAPAAGALVDRLSASRMLPFYLLPYCLVLVLVSLVKADLMVFVLLSGMGLSGGIAVPVVGATWAERYGVQHLGAIRSQVTVLMVVSTALAPPFLGWALDAGVTMQAITATLAGWTLLASLLTVGLRKR